MTHNDGETVIQAVTKVTSESDTDDTKRVTNPVAQAVTPASPKTHELESYESNHTTLTTNSNQSKVALRVCANDSERELKPPVKQPDEGLAKVLVDTGISKHVLPRAAALVSRSGRTLADVESLIKSVRENSRIVNSAAYVLKMIELDLYPEVSNDHATSTTTASPAYPFGNFTEGFDDNPRAIETRMKNLRDRKALPPEREQELMAKLAWARQYQATKQAQGGTMAC
jgi:hypothetical protein